MSNIYGTGNCFNDAIEILEILVKQEPALAHTEEFVLIHALGINSSGEVFSHAWLEWEPKGLAIWRGILDGVIYELTTPIADYRRKWKISRFTRYTIREVAMHNLRSGHFGPWEEIYDRHTRQGKREYEHSVNGRKSESGEADSGTAQRDIQNSGETTMGDKK